MLLSHFQKQNKDMDINKGIEAYKQTANAILLDVRSYEEYKQGHIENSLLIPVDEINKAADLIKDRDANIFVYCRSGARAGVAANALMKMGYTHVLNIGGILDYTGKIIK